MSGPRRRHVRKWRLAGLLGLLLLAGGCATRQSSVETPATSIQIVEYFPYLVKGYEGSFPRKRMIVLPAVEARPAQERGAELNGHPAIGVIQNQDNQIIERLYGPGISGLVQGAVVHAANEAGMSATAGTLPLQAALNARNADYVTVVRVLHAWVIKRRRPDTPQGKMWAAAAVVALDVTIYKPPFSIPFWQGIITASFDDPPPLNGALGDQTELYDQPGQVLSVALTRAAAGVFTRDDLRTLVRQDTMKVR